MALDDRQAARKSVTTAGGASEPQRTEVQTGDALAESVELSIPKHVQQHSTAPKVSGYILTNMLGAGAYGQVWRAWQLRTRKEVAVKVFTQRAGLDWIFLQREVERLTRLDRHPNIVTLLDTGLEEEPPHYVTDLIEGGSLQPFVQPQAPAAQSRALRWFREICDALGYVHAKGLIHCDLKPANILIDGQDRIRVVDFGQSRVFTESAASLGTLFYMAPEQAVLATPGAPVQPDIRWDVYALGATMYAILTGRVPYATPENVAALERAPSLADRLQCYRQIVATSPKPKWDGPGAAHNPELIAIVEKCMTLDPARRYPTVDAVEADLHALQSKRPVSPLARSSTYRTKKFVQRNPFLVGLAVAMVGLVAALTWSWVRGDRLDRSAARELLASFASEPVEAARTTLTATGRVNRYAKELIRQYLVSDAYTERVLGSRAGVVIEPTSFWKAVDTGPLWRHGEWLDALAYPSAGQSGPNSRWPVAPDLVLSLIEPFGGTSGSARQKYVALALLGQMRIEGAGLSEQVLGPAMKGDDPGVLSAALWCGRRNDVKLTAGSGGGLHTDETSGLTFAKIPGADSFKRGSDPGDPDRFANEDRPAQGVAIPSFYLATTETTYAAFRRFLDDPANKAAMQAFEVDLFRTQAAGFNADLLSRVAVGFISLETARAYCDWLNRKASGAQPPRKYRLPTEEEWEYASHGGNSGRFCFGDNAEYARYFAHCNGSTAPYHTVAEFMPNAYGLFDMHGGLWELTETRFPSELAPAEFRSYELYAKKGGAWYSPAVRCRSAQRNFTSPSYTDPSAADRYTGFRVVMEMAP